MPTVQQCHAMTSHYMRAYKDRYQKEPVVNRHRARWGFDSVLQSITPQECRKLIDFYLETVSTRQHALEPFFDNYTVLLEGYRQTQDDRAMRERLMTESEQRAKRWLERGNKRIAGNQRGTEE